MTAHIIMLFTVLLLFLFFQRSLYRGNSNVITQSFFIIAIMYALLPFTIPLITVIADYLFESFTGNLTWVSICFIPLWLLSVSYLYRNIRRGYDRIPIRIFWSVLMSAGLLAGYCCALLTSHYENGPTLNLSDSNFLTGYYIVIHIILLLTIITHLYLLVKNSRRSVYSWISGLLTLIGIVIYVAGLLSMKGSANF